ncbi:MAG TPA: Xaa-Pro peptidase family protein [Candidatus Acidoferrales bacterium]|nr:Xaa-Pro peptidase family protein [Candidatus Acidoferrales bacterium]
MERLGRLRSFFSGVGADALLVSHLPNIRYLCGFSGGAGLLLVEASNATLFTDSRYTFQAKEEVLGARVHIAKRGLIRAVGDALRGRRGRMRVAFSAGNVTVAQKDALGAAAGSRVRWVNDGTVVENLRAVKDAGELATMREAATLISEVFRRILRSIKPGVTELELAAKIEYGIKHLGGEGPSFETIVASGPRSAWAHARPSSKPLRKSELVVLDQGAILRGYCSDMTRTVFVGRATARVRGLYRAVLDAQQAAKSAIRPGVTAGDVDRAARQLLRRSNLARYFTHSTGHGLGLEVHEMPRIGRGDGTILQEGMVLTVEPGVYLEGLGGIRIEDDVVVTARGAVDLTTAPRDFLEL